MKKKKLLIMTLVVFCFLAFAGLIVMAQEEGPPITIENKIVVLKKSQDPIPGTLKISPGTTVIWVNHSRTPQEILFLDKKVVIACSSPVNFFVGKDGSYESAKIPFGGTASLCFTEKGKYAYLVKASETFYGAAHPSLPKDFKGIIWIE